MLYCFFRRPYATTSRLDDGRPYRLLDLCGLERHRRRPREVPSDPAGDLAAFVAEHARNAGPTLYLLRFGDPAPDRDAPIPPPVTRSLADVRSRSESSRSFKHRVA